MAAETGETSGRLACVRNPIDRGDIAAASNVIIRIMIVIKSAQPWPRALTTKYTDCNYYQECLCPVKKFS